MEMAIDQHSERDDKNIFMQFHSANDFPINAQLIS